MPRGKVAQVVGRVTPLLASLALMMFVLSGCGEASRASQEKIAKGRSTSTIRLELSSTNNSGVSGSATFTKAATGTRIELELRDLPEPDEIYLSHVHPDSCEDKDHHDPLEGETTDHRGHEHGHEELADVHVEEEHAEATADEIVYPLTPVESNAAGAGSSTTMLEGITLDELLSHGPRYLNVHATSSGVPPQLACANLREAS